MGLGRLFNKRKRATAVITPPLPSSSEQEVDSPIFPTLEEASTDRATAEEITSHHDATWYHGIMECSEDADADDSDNDYDDNDESLSCISNVDASAYHNGHDDDAVASSSHEEMMNFEDEAQGTVSMEVDIDNAGHQYDSQYCLSLSSPDTGFLHSSGRPTLQQEALCGMKKRTIDSEFEEYFASLLLN
ncbi:hypothetical protein GOP47_0015343 [Adiantum capillus-veneris]|uniref:Uncharacterized protein n=1 Tax=Adiantum capillus-veneris TaxID=13818 RepID=A0A9D4UK88_ADICA|nr:hypothetical protein GOP47_0015343 [Adiantum capillus-veneris]